jgi:hypothetical protein
MCKNVMAGRPNTVQKEENIIIFAKYNYICFLLHSFCFIIIKQKYIKTETAALNIKNQPKSSTENEKIEDISTRALTLSVRTEYIYSVASQATSPAPFKYLFNKYPY